MSTGLLIRDFAKQYRELRYSDSGSIGISEIEHNAYRLALTLEITHIAGPRYANLKTLPENTHFGYVSLFRGSTVTDSIAIKYPKFRVFDIINQGIWNYHQHTENMMLLSQIEGQLAAAEADNIIEEITGVLDAPRCFILRGLFPQGADPVADFVLKWQGCLEPPGANEVPFVDAYRAFPIATPFPDIAKFKADISCSFLWRLEQWYLVNPAVYIADNPTDAGDETEGEDEYPEPISGEPFPESSPAGEGRDPRDFTGGSDSEIPFEGGQCEGVMYRVNIETDFAIAPPYSVSFRDVVGPVKGIRSELVEVAPDVFTRRFFLRHGNPETEVSLGGAFLVICEGSPPVCSPNPGQFAILNVQRLDGEPDNCGNPLPIPT